MDGPQKVRTFWTRLEYFALRAQLVSFHITIGAARQVTTLPSRAGKTEQLEMALAVTAVGRKRLFMKLQQRPDESDMRVKIAQQQMNCTTRLLRIRLRILR